MGQNWAHSMSVYCLSFFGVIAPCYTVWTARFRAAR